MNKKKTEKNIFKKHYSIKLLLNVASLLFLPTLYFLKLLHDLSWGHDIHVIIFYSKSHFESRVPTKSSI